MKRNLLSIILGVIKIVFIASFTIAIIMLFTFAGVMYGMIKEYSKELPSVSNIEKYETPLKTQVYAATYNKDGSLVADVPGELLYEFYQENRVVKPVEQISPVLMETIVINEDVRFWKHWGIDIWGIIRAGWSNLKAGQIVQGGSTLTQQLARNLFLTQEKKIKRKIQEAILSFQIERHYTKKEILERYLNHIYFGEGAYGTESASLTYFKKHDYQLNISECALLAGLPKSPISYSPFNHPQTAIKRRNVILEKMLFNGMITPKDFEKAKIRGTRIVQQEIRKNDAPYFVEHIRRTLEKELGEIYGKGLSEEKRREIGSEKLYKGGFKVYTTLDLKMNKMAKDALDRGLKELEDRHKFEFEKSGDTTANIPRLLEAESDTTTPKTQYIQGSLVAIDPATGYIKAFIGGRDFYESHFIRVTQAKRQPGSAFKPFVYTTAIDKGYSPSYIVLDCAIVDTVMGEEWKPSNWGSEFRGPTTLRDGLRLSRNTISVRLIKQVDPSNVVKYAKKMGIKSNIQAVYSLALGTCEVDLLELTSAYGTLANKGVRTEPISILRIEDRDGNIIKESKIIRTDAISEKTAYIMTNMMEDVINAGTGAIIREKGFKHPAAGKTGTTSNFDDAWFIGFTPNLVTGVWVGFDDRRPIGDVIGYKKLEKKNYLTGEVRIEKKPIVENPEPGGSVSAPIWAYFMKSVYDSKELEVKNFFPPPGIVVRKICTKTGLLATKKCPKTTTEIYIGGSEPSQYCVLHMPTRDSKTPFELIDREKNKKYIDYDKASLGF